MHVMAAGIHARGNTLIAKKVHITAAVFTFVVVRKNTDFHAALVSGQQGVADVITRNGKYANIDCSVSAQALAFDRLTTLTPWTEVSGGLEFW